MIEEPENGLTPKALKSFYEAVRTLAYSDDDTSQCQVMMSSHSPFAICEAWNGEDRNFIYQVKVEGGKSSIKSFAEVVEQSGFQLAKENGERKVLSLKVADQIMSNYYY